MQKVGRRVWFAPVAHPQCDPAPASESYGNRGFTVSGQCPSGFIREVAEFAATYWIVSDAARCPTFSLHSTPKVVFTLEVSPERLGKGKSLTWDQNWLVRRGAVVWTRPVSFHQYSCQSTQQESQSVLHFLEVVNFSFRHLRIKLLGMGLLGS